MRSRPLTSSCSRRLRIPAVASCTRPRCSWSITVTPVGPIAMLVDVRPAAAGAAPVVHQDDVCAVQAQLKRAGGRCFALGAVAPRAHVARFVGQRRDE
jgi:hypothetical protein